MYEAVEYNHCVIIDQKLNAQGKAHPNPRVKCTHCTAVFSGGPSRIRGHILGISSRGGGTCSGDTPAAEAARTFFQEYEDGFETNKSKKRKRSELDELTEGPGTAGSSAGLVQQGIREAFMPKRKQVADQAVADYFYAEGTPFIKVESDYFQDMVTAIGNHGPGYKPPSMKRLRTTMLDEAVERVKQQMQVGGHQ